MQQDLHARLLNLFGLNSFLPDETSMDCHQCKIAGKPIEQTEYLINKCCYFIPYFPNFSVGQMCAKRELSAQLLTRLSLPSCTPLGFGPEPGEKAVCPFFLDRRCSIWHQRPAVCSTFFCNSQDGLQGVQRWNQIYTFLQSAEVSIATDILLQLGLVWPEISVCLKTLPSEFQQTNKNSWLEFGSTVPLKMEFFKRTWQVYLGFSDSYLLKLLDAPQRLCYLRSSDEQIDGEAKKDGRTAQFV